MASQVHMTVCRSVHTCLLPCLLYVSAPATPYTTPGFDRDCYYFCFRNVIPYHQEERHDAALPCLSEAVTPERSLSYLQSLCTTQSMCLMLGLTTISNRGMLGRLCKVLVPNKRRCYLSSLSPTLGLHILSFLVAYLP